MDHANVTPAARHRDAEPALELALVDALFSHASEAVLVESADRTVLAANAAYAATFAPGLAPEDLAGVGADAVVRAADAVLADADALRGCMERLVRGGVAATGGDVELADGRVFELAYAPARPRPAQEVHVWRLRDVTEGRATLRALRASELRGQVIAQATSDAVWDWDLAANTIWWSVGLTTLFGYPAGDVGLTPNWYEDRIHPEDKVRVIDGLRAAVASGRSEWRDEYRFARRDGEWADVLDRAEVLRDAAGVATRIIGSVVDITQRKGAEESLRRSELRYRSLLANIPDVAWTADANGRAVFISPKIEQTFGFTPEEIYGTGERLWLGRIHPDDVGRVRQAYERLFECGERFEVEYRIRRKDGEWIWWYDRALSTYERDGVVYTDGLLSDVTARKRAEQAATESEARLRLALEAARMGTWEWDVARDEATGSAELERIHGIPPGSFGGTFDAYPRDIHPEDRERVLAGIRRTLDRGTEYRTEYRIVRPDGAVRWLEAKGQVVRDTDGRPLRMAGICMDVTDRRQYEEALRESERRHRLLVERNLAGVFRSTLDGRLLDCNDTFARIFGFESKEQLQASSTADLYFDPVGREEYLRNLRERGSVTNFEICLRRRDGSPVWVLENVSLETYDGAPDVLEGTLVDITDKKLAETAVRRATELAQERQQDLLFRLAGVALALGTARDLTSIFRALADFLAGSLPCNAVFVALYDPERRQRSCVYARSEGVEIDVSTLPPAPMNDNPMSRAIETAEPVVVDDFQQAVAGIARTDIGMDVDPRLPRSSLTVPMAGMGRVIGAVEVQGPELAMFTAEHVTVSQMAANLATVAAENVRLLEREREHQERLRVSQRMEAVGRLAGGVAHDFNNLLTVITGYSDLMLKRLSERDPLRADAREIRDAAARAAALTGQLLAFSRKQVLQPKVLSLNALVENLERMLRRLIGEDIELVTSLDPNLPCVEADPSQLEQVLTNLIVNARDAMPDGGRLTISTATSVLERGAGPTGAAVLTVSDTGCGMDEETLSHIFEPFFTTKEVGKGTGLGLATVYGIVEQSRGRIDVESEPGRGTSIRVSLPAAAAASEASGAGGGRSDCRGTETILLVEDEDGVRRFVAEALRQCGYRVLEARGGEEALRASAALDGGIDLVISDVVMPKMSGGVLVERLTALRPGIKALYISGYTEDDVVRRGVAGAGTAFLAKPFTVGELTRKVRATLGS